MRPLHWNILLVAILLPSSAFAQPQESITVPNEISTAAGEDSIVGYDRIQPVLKKHCVSCHNDEEMRGSLSLSSLERIALGSGAGPVVVPGRAEESPLFLVTAHLENPKMPPNRPRISERELDLLRKWIRTGATTEFNESKMQQSGTETAAQSTGSIPTSESRKELLRRMPRRSALTAAVPIREKQQLCMAGFDQLIWYDINSRTYLNEAIVTKNQQVTGLRWEPECTRLWAAVGTPGERGEIVCFDVGTGKVHLSVGAEEDTIPCFDLSPSCKLLAVGTRSRKVLLYSVEAGNTTLLHAWSKHTDWVTSLAFSPDNLLVASADRFGTVQVWDTTTGEEFATLRGHTGTVSSLIWSVDGDSLYSAGWDGFLRRWNLHDGSQQEQRVLHTKGVLGMKSASGGRFLSSNDQLLSHGREGEVALYDLATNQKVNAIRFAHEIVQLEAFATEPKDGSSSAMIVLASDVEGNGYEIHGLAADAPQIRDWPLPLQLETPSVPIRRPPAIARLKNQSPSNSTRPESLGDSRDAFGHVDLQAGSLDQPLLHGFNITEWKNRLSVQLVEAEHALEQIQSSKETLVKALSTLEESEAKLKQMILLQQQSLKQVESIAVPPRKPSK